MKRKFDYETQVADSTGTDLDAMFCDLGHREQPRHDQDENCQVMLFSEHQPEDEQEDKEATDYEGQEDL